MKTEKSRKRVLEPATLRSLRRLVSDVGEAEVLRVMEVRPETLYRALAGLPVLSGTRALVDKALAALVSTAGAA
jgi:hypothetical protein